MPFYDALTPAPCHATGDAPALPSLRVRPALLFGPDDRPLRPRPADDAACRAAHWRHREWLAPVQHLLRDLRRTDGGWNLRAPALAARPAPRGAHASRFRLRRYAEPGGRGL